MSCCRPWRWHSAPRAPRRTRARALLDQVGLGAVGARRPYELSGGERQRVAVARAMINRPRLLLADEPTGALDQAAADALAETLLALNREHGTALIIVTHAAALARRMGRVVTLAGGVVSLALSP